MTSLLDIDAPTYHTLVSELLGPTSRLWNVVGHTGTGKTTLLRHLAKLLPGTLYHNPFFRPANTSPMFATRWIPLPSLEDFPEVRLVLLDEPYASLLGEPFDGEFTETLTRTIELLKERQGSMVIATQLDMDFPRLVPHLPLPLVRLDLEQSPVLLYAPLQ